MLGFFEWISDDLSPQGDAYDPAIARPRCKKCGKDAWLTWNGKYSSYCSTECQNKDIRKKAARSSVGGFLPSRGVKEPITPNVFERALAAKKAARYIKGIAKKWSDRKKKGFTKDADAHVEKTDFTSTREDVHKSDFFVEQRAEVEFDKKRAHLMHVAEELAKEQLRSPKADLIPTFQLSTTAGRPADRCVIPSDLKGFSEGTAALEQAFAEEVRRQAEEEQSLKRVESLTEVPAEACDMLQSSREMLRTMSLPPGYDEKANQTHPLTCETKDWPVGQACNRDFTLQESGDNRSSMGEDSQLNNKKAKKLQEIDQRATTVDNFRGGYNHSVEQPEPTASSELRTRCSAEARISRYQRRRRSTKRNFGRLHRKRPYVPVRARLNRSLYDSENDLQFPIAADFQQKGRSRSRSERERPPLRSRRLLDTSPPTESAKAFTPQIGASLAYRATDDESLPAKLSCTGNNQQNGPAEAQSSPLAKSVSQGDVAPLAHLQTTTAGVMRVANASHMYVTSENLFQLRDAAWKETKMAIEQICTCCVRGGYAGTLSVYVESAEGLNPARVSAGDNLYVVVRCQVAEAECVERRSRYANNFKWGESFRFPVVFESYPEDERVCVQLWKRTQRGRDVRLFIGEGEIPYPVSSTRCALRVHLCWNTHLGGNVVDLDCGCLRLSLQFHRSTRSEVIVSTPPPTSAVASGAQEDVQGARGNSTSLQEMSPRKAQEVKKERHTTENSCGPRGAKISIYTNYEACKDDARNPVRIVHMATACRKVADGGARQGMAEEGRQTQASFQTLKAYPSFIAENTLPQYVEGSTDDEEPQVDLPRFTAKGQNSSSGKIRVRRENVSTITWKEFKWPTPGKEKQLLPQEKRVKGSEDNRDSCAAAPAPPNDMPLTAGTHLRRATGADFATTGHEPTYAASTSTENSTNTVKADSCRERVQGYVPGTKLVSTGEQQTRLHIEQRLQESATDMTFSASPKCHSGISHAELRVVLPVVMAQMEDLVHYDRKPQCVPPAANLDPCVLAQPWGVSRGKQVRCANKACQRIVNNKLLSDLFEEEEYRAWGCCSTCQGKMFGTKLSSISGAVVQISRKNGMYNEFRLDSFIPVAFPDFTVIWPSSRHLYVAQRFTQIQIQDRFRRCTTQRELSLILMAPLLKYFARPDWRTYRRVALHTCIRLKIQQHPRLQLLLASTGDAVLVDPSLPDFWEWESEAEAKKTNLAGELLMEIRSEYL